MNYGWILFATLIGCWAVEAGVLARRYHRASGRDYRRAFSSQES
jgi:hypothetical protein